MTQILGQSTSNSANLALDVATKGTGSGSSPVKSGTTTSSSGGGGTSAGSSGSATILSFGASANVVTAGYGPTGSFGSTVDVAGADAAYLAAYPDAAQAVASGVHKNGLDHYLSQGAALGYSYNAVSSQQQALDQAYLAANPDAAAAVGSGAYATGLDFFLGQGAANGESYGKLAGSGIDPSTVDGQYLRANQDALLAVASGQDFNGAAYYLRAGAAAGQSYGKLTAASVDPTTLDGQYLRANADALQSVASGQSATGLAYFLSTGYQSGGAYGSLNAASLTGANGAIERAYLQAHPDVALQVAQGQYASGLQEFFATGYAKGRHYGQLSSYNFDPTTTAGGYLQTYTDAAYAVASGSAPSAFAYYLSTGAAKGEIYAQATAQTVLSSTGDPHIAIGKSAGGKQVETLKYDDQHDIANFLDTAQLGGIHVATGVTAINKQGVAVNKSIQITDAAAHLTITVSEALVKGKLTEQVTIDGTLPSDATVTNANGTVTVKFADGNQSLNLAITQAGTGLNLTATANNIATGGAVVAALAKQEAQAAAGTTAANGNNGLAYFLGTGAAKGESYGALGPIDAGTVEGKYLLANQDALKAVASGASASGAAYFLSTGAAKGETYGKLTAARVDAKTLDGAYLRDSRDALTAVASGAAADGLSYFLGTGAALGESYGALQGAALDPTTIDGAYLRATPAALTAVAKGQYADGLHYYLAKGVAAGADYGALSGSSLTAPGQADELAYLRANSDVAAQVAAGTVSSGLQQFLTTGYAQGLTYGKLSAATYDPTTLDGAYLQANRDAAAAVAAGRSASGLDYFLTSGIGLGETYGALDGVTLSSAGQAAERAYLQANPSVAAQVAAGTYASGLAQFTAQGYAAGLTYNGLNNQSFAASPLDSAYLAANPDAVTAVASGQAASPLDYFQTTGAGLGESYGAVQGSALDPSTVDGAYLGSNQAALLAVANGQFTNGLAYYLGQAVGPAQNYGALNGTALTDPNQPAELAYLKANQSVAASVAAGTLASGLREFLEQGYVQGRSYGSLSAANYDPTTIDGAYLKANADAAAAVANGQASSGLGYFLSTGVGLGQSYGALNGASLSVPANAAELAYLQLNPTIAGQVAAGTFASGLAQFAAQGYAAGLSYGGLNNQSYDPTSNDGVYLAKYADAVAAVASGQAASPFGYFIATGAAKGEVYGTDKPTNSAAGAVEAAYLAANPAAAAGLQSGQYASGLDYYLKQGFQDGGPAYGLLNTAAITDPVAGALERAYLVANNDVAQSIASSAKGYASGLDQFLSLGYAQGRGFGALKAANYSPATTDGLYLYLNRDAAKAVALGTAASGLDYFLTTGAANGQSFGALTAQAVDPTTLDGQYLRGNAGAAQAVASGQYSNGLDYFLKVGAAAGQSYGAIQAANLTGTTGATELAYLQANADIAAGVASGTYASGLDQFLSAGFGQGKSYGLLSSLNYTPTSTDGAYLQANHDAAAAIASGQYASASAYYLGLGASLGERYGNLTPDQLDPTKLDGQFLSANADAARAVAAGTATSGLDYVLKNGLGAGQSYGALTVAKIDPGKADGAYLQANQDVAAAVAAGTYASGVDQWLKTGALQGKTYNGFTLASAAAAAGITQAQLAAGTITIPSPPPPPAPHALLARAALFAAAAAPAPVTAQTLSDDLQARLAAIVNSAQLPSTGTVRSQTDAAYLTAHPDAQALITEGLYVSGFDHWIHTGNATGYTYNGQTLTQAEAAYISNYTDLSAAYQASQAPLALQHFLTSGEREGRSFAGTTVQSLQGTADQAYLLAHPDAQQAVASGRYQSGLDYWLANDASRGVTYNGQTLTDASRNYVLNYPDLYNGYLNFDIAQHLLNFGLNEGRSFAGTSADVIYLAAHPQANAQVASGQYDSGLKQWVAQGAANGWLYNGLSLSTAEQNYLNEYQDVANAWYNDAGVRQIYPSILDFARAHFLSNGYDETRHFAGESKPYVGPGDAGQASSLLDWINNLGGSRNAPPATPGSGPTGGSTYNGYTFNQAARAYFSANGDVANRLLTVDFPTQGLDHFKAIGGPSEGRSFAGTSDAAAQASADQAYLNSNAAARNAVANRQYANGFDYWLHVGAANGDIYNGYSLTSAENTYLHSYGDVQTGNATTFAADHFIAHGAGEGRSFAGITLLDTAISKAPPSGTIASSPTEQAYLAANPDVANLVASGQYKSGLDYFLAVGRTSGSTAQSHYGNLKSNDNILQDSAEQAYLRANPDVASAIAASATPWTGLQHYLQFGRKEGRTYGVLASDTALTNPSTASAEAAYLLANPDVARSVATNGGTGLQHYLTFGYSEGRAAYGQLANDPWLSLPAERQYLNNNPTVATQVATGAKNADGTLVTGLSDYIARGRAAGSAYGQLAYDTVLQGPAAASEIAYLAANPDVRDAVIAGNLSSGLSHFLNGGYTDSQRGNYGNLTPVNLLGSADDFNYIKSHIDAAMAVAAGLYHSGLTYFLDQSRYNAGETWGNISVKGLQSDPLLSGNTRAFEIDYLSNNPDVAVAVGSGVISNGLVQYVGEGYHEKRTAWGGGQSGLAKDPYLLGQDPVDESGYLIAHQDVAIQIAQGTYESGYQHYNEVGFAKGFSYGGGDDNPGETDVSIDRTPDATATGTDASGNTVTITSTSFNSGYANIAKVTDSNGNIVSLGVRFSNGVSVHIDYDKFGDIVSNSRTNADGSVTSDRSLNESIFSKISNAIDAQAAYYKLQFPNNQWGSQLCATAVVHAFDSIGIAITPTRLAADLGPSFAKAGFSDVTAGYNTTTSPKAGDVAIFSRASEAPNEAGHVEVFNGRSWVSDYDQGKQSSTQNPYGFSPNPGRYPTTTESSKVTIYRKN